jgi:fibronectin type 3 domain-containing protein
VIWRGHAEKQDKKTDLELDFGSCPKKQPNPQQTITHTSKQSANAQNNKNYPTNVETINRGGYSLREQLKPAT